MANTEIVDSMSGEDILSQERTRTPFQVEDRVTMSKRMYRTLSVLTLGLPQTVNFFSRTWREMDNEFNRYEIPGRSTIYDLRPLGAALVIAGQVAAIGYGYFHVAKGIIGLLK